MKEKDLIEFWNELIDIDIYKVTSEEYLQEINNKGLGLSYDPFKGIYENIGLLFKLLLKYENKRVIYQEEWRDGFVTASDIIKFNQASRIHNYLDFVTDTEQALKFYRKWQGEVLTNVLYNFTNFIQNQELSLEEKQLVNQLYGCANKKRNYNNKIITVKGSDPVFASAKLLCLP